MAGTLDNPGQSGLVNQCLRTGSVRSWDWTHCLKEQLGSHCEVKALALAASVHREKSSGSWNRRGLRNV